MANKYKKYQQHDHSVPEKTQTWNLYGAGVENIGKDGQPEAFNVPEPNKNQLLVRVDAVGLCFSDVKLINQGGAHPKLYNRDLKLEPTRLGHETSVTVVKVGENLKNDFKAGERYAMQPDMYQDGKSTAYGYTVPGGLIQYHLIGPEVLDTDTGSCMVKLSDQLGFGESALLEPWGCVWAAYTQRRRLDPKKNGIMWIVGQPGDSRDYQFSNGLDAPGEIVLTDVSPQLKTLVEKTGCKITVRDNLAISDYEALVSELTDSKGFDDIVVLAPKSAFQVETIARFIARRGTMNMIGTEPLDGLVKVDVGRLHYDYIAFIGNQGPDISDSYGEPRNRCDLQSSGTTVVIGAGGPMGQMHVQRAIESPNGPSLVIISDINEARLVELEARFKPLAENNNRKLLIYNPNKKENSIREFLLEANNGKGADDVVVCVPVAGIMEEAATLMNQDGMMVLFAGVPNGTYAPVDLSIVYQNNAQYTGTSGLTIEDQIQVMESAEKGIIAPSRSIAAIGGMKAAQEGIKAMIESRYPGKILIFPQLLDLPLMGLDELKEKLPAVGSKLGPGNTWTREAEIELIETCWTESK